MKEKSSNNEEVKKTKKVTKEEEIRLATKNAQKDMFLDIAPYLIIIFFIVIIRTFIATPVSVSGSSMYPTLHNGDTMILYKLTKKTRGIKRFDIVVIKTDSGKLIKRVIGLPGDKIEYKKVEKDGKEILQLYVNGKAKKETFINQKSINQTCFNDWEICTTELVIPEGEYFVLGDNRENSKDSRMIGTVNIDDIMGTTELVIFPFNRFGVKN